MTNGPNQWVKKRIPELKREMGGKCSHRGCGERRLRAHMAVGLPEIEAEVRELTDYEAKEIRLIENIHRTDLTDAEKGDGFLALWRSPECPHNEKKTLAEKLQLSYDDVCHWIMKSTRFSPKVKNLLTGCAPSFTDYHARYLLKYSHSNQDRLAEVSIQKNLTSRQLQELTKKYDLDNKANLEEIANEILGLPKTVTIPITQLTEEQKQAIRKEKVADVNAHKDAYKLKCENHAHTDKATSAHDARMRRLGKR